MPLSEPQASHQSATPPEIAGMSRSDRGYRASALLGQPVGPDVSCAPLGGSAGGIWVQGAQRAQNLPLAFSSARKRCRLADPRRRGARIFWYYFPDATLLLFKWAGSIRESVVGGYWPARYEVVMRALVDERQIVYMGFVLATRIIVGLLMMPVYRVDRPASPGGVPSDGFRIMPRHARNVQALAIVNPILTPASIAWA